MAKTLRADALFASYNIHKCVGTDRRFDPDRIEAVIEEIGADVLAIQEADRRFGDRSALLDLNSIHKRTGLVPVPVSNGHKGHGWHGNLLMVREGSVSRMRQIDLPGHEPRGALVADLELPTGPVRVVAAHLGLLRQARLVQISTLVAAARDSTDRPIVLMGDMNEWRVQRRSALLGLAPGFGPDRACGAEFPGLFPDAGARPDPGASAYDHRGGRGARFAAGAEGLGPSADQDADPAEGGARGRRSRGRRGARPSMTNSEPNMRTEIR